MSLILPERPFIFIPSRSRANRIETVDQFPERLLSSTAIVVREDQYAEYRAARPDLRVLPVPEPHADGIAAKRQWIHDYAMSIGSVRYIQMDDDIRFFARKSKDSKIEKASPREVDKMVCSMMDHLKPYKYPLVTIAPRFMAQNRPWPTQENIKAMNVVGIYGPTLEKEGIRWDELELAEDLYVCASLLSSGYRNLCLTDMIHSARYFTNAGGCQDTRKTDQHNAVFEDIAQRFPHCMKLKRIDNDFSRITFYPSKAFVP